MPDITISTTAAQTIRIAAAFGQYWRLTNPDGTPRDATAAEVKEYLVRQLKGVVRNYERALGEAAVTVENLLVT